MKFKADFSNVSEGGGRLPAGDYVCKITKAELKDGAKGKYISWELTVGVGSEKGQKTYHNTSLTVKALFKLRDFMVACGIPVPKSIVDVDTDVIVGKIVGITVTDSTYTNKEGKVVDSTEIKDIYEVKKVDGRGWVKASEATVDLDAAGEGAAPPWASKPEEDVTEIEL